MNASDEKPDAEETCLDPAILAWHRRIAELEERLPGAGSADLATRRRAAVVISDILAAEFTAPPPLGIHIHDDSVVAPHGAIPVRIYRRGDAPAAAPTQVFAHGGGFIMGSIQELVNDRLLAARALDSGVQIISVDYRLAPEHPYPAGVEDLVAVVSAIAVQPDRFGADAARIGLGGSSAGATTAASTALRLLADGGPAIVHQALEVPAAALRAVGESAERFPVDDAEQLRALYLGSGAPPDAYASPLDAPELAGLPRTLIAVAEHDGLRDGGLAYARRLQEAGVPVRTLWGAGHVHASSNLTAAWQAARDWHDEVAAELRAAYS